MLTFLSVLIAIVPAFFTTLLLRDRLRKTLTTWSTSDFLPMLACGLLGIVIARAIEFFPEQLFNIDTQILNDGIFPIRYGITTGVTMSSLYWYKSLQYR
jgi:multisubunit Na+/H+ antiporter MnhB subunit